MPSAIDPTKPVQGNPTTESVRDNFAAAKSEIEVLQLTAGVGPQGPAGPTGPAGSITVNPTVITGPAGSNASVTVGGTPQAATIQFTVPRGDTGAGGGGITETQAVDAVRRAQPRFEEAAVTTAPTFPTGPNIATTAPTVTAGWALESGGDPVLGPWEHTSGTTTLAWPATIANGTFYQIAFTITRTSAQVYNFFAIYFRTAPTATAGQQLILTGVSASLPALNVLATGNFSHVVIVPVTGWQGTITLTRIVAFPGPFNSAALSVKDQTTIVRGTNRFEGGGGKISTSTFAAAYGANALNAVTTATNLTAFGTNALSLCSTGSSNTAFGYLAMRDVTSGANNEGFGYLALSFLQVGAYNSAHGRGALYNMRHGDRNTAVGGLAMYTNYSSAENVAVGYSAYRYSSGSNNVVIGSFALVGSTGVVASGSNSVAVGSSAARFIANGTTLNGDGGQSVYIGAETRAAATSQINQIVIGYNAIGGGSNTITLGNGDITQLRCNVQTIAALSDSRVKENIHLADLNICLEAVKSLPVNRWKWLPIAGFRRDHNVTGFLSGDLKKVFPHAVSVEDEYLTVRDADGSPVYKTVTEVIQPEPEDAAEGALPEIQTRQIQETTKIEGLARIELTEIVPTLWGAVQQLIHRIEALEKPTDNPAGTAANPGTSESKGGFFRGKK